MDFHDDEHSLAELVFQGASEFEPSPELKAEVQKVVGAWHQRSDQHSPCAEMFHMQDCSVFSITYQGESGDYWPCESDTSLTETLIREFLFDHGICSLTDDHEQLICMKYQIMALDGDEHVMICPYLTEAGNISGIVVVCLTKMMRQFMSGSGIGAHT
jgi:hypothetical protein